MAFKASTPIFGVELTRPKIQHFIQKFCGGSHLYILLLIHYFFSISFLDNKLLLSPRCLFLNRRYIILNSDINLIYSKIYKRWSNLSQLVVYFILGGIVFVLCFGIIYLIILKILKFRKQKYLPQRATSFKCLDDHIVKSKGELIIDNYLHHLGLNHEYENTIRIIGKSLKYDWYLPELDVYIEYWGYFGKDYMKRKEEKLDLYRKGKSKLISIEDIMLQDIYSNLETELAKYIEFNEKTAVKKYCPNCGFKLDKRF